jgi:lysozyme
MALEAVVDSLIEQLKRDEGLRLTPYRCTENKLTIGYGRNLEDTGISKEEAEFLLSSDVQRVMKDVAKALPWISGLNEPRRGVLFNMAFQMGVPGLLKFKNTLKYVKDGLYQAAALGMMDSKWAKQTPERAARLADQMMYGEWK